MRLSNTLLHNMSVKIGLPNKLQGWRCSEQEVIIRCNIWCIKQILCQVWLAVSLFKGLRTSLLRSCTKIYLFEMFCQCRQHLFTTLKNTQIFNIRYNILSVGTVCLYVESQVFPHQRIKSFQTWLKWPQLQCKYKQFIVSCSPILILSRQAFLHFMRKSTTC